MRCFRYFVTAAVVLGFMLADMCPAGAQQASSGPLPSCPVPDPNAPRAILVCDEPVYDFGEVDEDTKVEHTFVVKNVGNAPAYNTYLQPSGSGCAISKSVDLEPGAEAGITATLYLKGRQGETRKCAFFMFGGSHDFGHGPEVTMKGIVIAPLMYEPRMFNFGRVTDSAQPVKITLHSTDEPFHILAVTCPESCVQITHVPVEAGRVYELTATLSPLPSAGTLNAQVIIKTDHPKRPKLIITAFADVKGPIDVSPRTIVFRQSDDPAQKITQVVKVAPGTLTGFEVTEVVSPDDRIKIELMPREDGVYLIKVIDMPCDGSLDGKELVVKTSAAELPEVRIPFKKVPVPAQPITPQMVRPNAERRPAVPAAAAASPRAE